MRRALGLVNAMSLDCERERRADVELQGQDLTPEQSQE